MNINDCKLIEIPKIHDARGNLSFLEKISEFQSGLNRLYYLYDVPAGSVRGGHAHKENHAIIISVAGSFDVVLDDGSKRKKITLNRPYIGLYVPPMVWRELENFSSGSVCLVAASLEYDENDYYRNYNDFLNNLNSDENTIP